MECNYGYIAGLHSSSSIYDLIGSANSPAGVMKTYLVSPDPTYIYMLWKLDYSWADFPEVGQLTKGLGNVTRA